MHNLRAALINEIVKIASRKKTVFFLLLTAVVPAAAALLSSRLQSGFGVTAIAAADLPMLVLNIMTAIVVPLLVFMTAADLFAGEIGEKTMRIALMRPVTRWKVFAAKQIALLFYIGIYLLEAFAVSVIAACFVSFRGGLLQGALHALAANAAAVLPMIALGAAAVFVSLLFRSGSGALAVCILLYAAAKLSALVYPQLVQFTPAAYTEWHLLWFGGTLASGKLFTIFSLLLAWCLISLSAGFYVFDKKEL
jgi:ABC-2 type transport system permease protein